MSATPQPPAQGAPPEKQGNLLWWVLGLLAAGVLLLTLGMYVAARFVLQNVEVVQAPGRVEVRSPLGGLSVAQDAAADPSLPVFPGAQVTSPGATVELSPPDDDPVFITTARYRTSAGLAEVDSWYQEHLDAEFTREGPGWMEKKQRIFGVEVSSNDVAFLAEKDAYLKVVVLRQRPLGTEIALARIGREEPH